MAKKQEILPSLFLDRMEKICGEKFEDFMKAMEQDPPVSVRINPEKFKPLKEPEKVPWCNSGYYLSHRPSFTLDPLFHAGAYYPQEPGSMFLEQAFIQLGVENKPLLILDLCGAPGGKSTHLLALMNKESLLISNEVIRQRAAILKENIYKWGQSNVMITNNDPRDFAALGAVFDLIVVDAPCSGEGLFRKDRSAVDEWSPDNAALCSARQKRILADAWQCLKPGGFMVYSTCTFNPEENEVNLDWMAEQGNGVSVPLSINPEWGIREINYNRIRGYRLLPHLIRGEGFFMGILQKIDGVEQKFPVRKNGRIQIAGKKQSDAVKTWVNYDQDDEIIEDGQDLVLFKKNRIRHIHFFSVHLKIIGFGCPVAEKTGNLINPLHTGALSVHFNHAFPYQENLTVGQAIQFLKREPFQMQNPSKGWILVKFKNIPLGWIKNVGNRFNNYYPPAWRIRMASADQPGCWHDGIL